MLGKPVMPTPPPTPPPPSVIWDWDLKWHGTRTKSGKVLGLRPIWTKANMVVEYKEILDSKGILQDWEMKSCLLYLQIKNQ